MSDPTFAEGDIVRVRGLRGTFRIVKFELVRGEVVLWGGTNGKSMTRYVTTDRLLPAKKNDPAPAGFGR